ncbi:hypothetical protein VCHA53O466_50071 [Vibrio chagasii]|nr:hypothetical protein VCHA53O466_50071 [Vibrio chagasii]
MMTTPFDARICYTPDTASTTSLAFHSLKEQFISVRFYNLVISLYR